MYIGYKLHAYQPNKGFFATSKQDVLQEAVSIIQSKYVDSVNVDSLEANAINEMMNELDPHSVYLPPADLKETNEDLSGNFQGIGVEFNQIRDTVNVTYIIKGGPSDKAGMMIGDQIIKANGQNLTGKNITTAQIRNLIRGENGSKVVLNILRNKKPVSVTITRGNIPTPSIVAAYMLSDKTGYIKFLNSFTSSSYREFMQSLEALKKQGLKELVFDLRGNGGGYMDQAIEIADEFLDGDKLIVYTQGTNSPKKEYRCKRPGIFETGKLVVLVDELSASASEILSGALQDWGRATIIGRRTFGKGLVQELFPLKDGSALKLTVSRYYTPLGRSIQRPYSQGKKVYMDEIWNRYANGQAYYADSNKVNNGKQYKTPQGKILYGGGGIMPDIFVGLDTTNSSNDINKLYYSGSFNDFIFNYYLQHKNILDAYPTPQSYAIQFSPSKDMWDSLVVWAKKDTVNITHASAAEKQKIEARMEAYLARYKWRDMGFYQIINQTDPAIKKAIEFLKAP